MLRPLPMRRTCGRILRSPSSVAWIFAVFSALFGFEPQTHAAQGPGINQVTWLPSEVGKEVYTFSTQSLVPSQR